ncbi:helix-turn-helix transcriptional regulator [Tritonibacter scottomollicae]|uniref:helix-turn-helix transcriptional regulator n=1 Tax=Tritonibacter scottomollicae TaxID=483013 RepID=UPI003AA974B3
MTLAEILNALSAPLSLGIALFAAHVLLLRRDNRCIYVPLALFFIAQGVLELHRLLFLGALMWKLSTDLSDLAPALHGPMRLLTALTFPALLALAPLFWLYVDALTRETRAPWRHWPLHFAPALFAGVVALPYLLLPMDVLDDAPISPEAAFAGLALAVSYALLALTLFLHLQIAGYVVATLYRLFTYHSRLKDLFASTDTIELRWINALALSMGLYWLVTTLGLAATLLGKQVPNADTAGTLSGVAALWCTALWGIRQKPGFSHEVSPVQQTGPDKDRLKMGKYTRSALTDEHARRIAEKISLAMQRDQLYRDPNLSLWDLAKHISTSSNYVSQTLNETIGETFFDYVNRWRIKDAVREIEQTDQTIMTIAYDVGFNSRSSFYKAFKREVGGMPTALPRPKNRVTKASPV